MNKKTLFEIKKTLKYHKIGTNIDFYIYDEFYSLILSECFKNNFSVLTICAHNENIQVINQKFNQLMTSRSKSTYNQHKSVWEYFNLATIDESNNLVISQDLITVYKDYRSMNDESLKQRYYDFLLEVFNSKLKEFVIFLNSMINDEQLSDDVQEQNDKDYTTIFSLLLDNNIEFKNDLNLLIHVNEKNKFWKLFNDFNSLKNDTPTIKEIKEYYDYIRKIFKLDNLKNIHKEIFTTSTREIINHLSEKNWENNLKEHKNIEEIEILKLNVKKYFNNIFYEISSLNIPIYQRNYVWDFKIIETLLNDIFLIYENKQEHYISTTIFSYNTKNNSYSIIDGQQRTTTLILISFGIYLYYIKNFIKNETNGQMDDKTYKMIPNIFHKMFGSATDKITKNNKFENLSSSESYKYFFDLIDMDIDVILETKDDLIIDNLLQIYSWIKNKFAMNLEEFNNFVKSFLNHLIITKISLPNSDGYKYFEKYNTLGIKLNDLDLLKSLFYNHLKDKKICNSESEVNKKIKEVDKQIFDNFKKKNSRDLNYRKLEKFTNFVLFVNSYDKKDIDYFKTSKLSWIYESFNQLLLNNDQFMDEIFNLSIIYNLITSKNNDEFNKNVDKLVLNKDGKEDLKLIFHYIFSISQGGSRSVYTNLIYAILNKFIFSRNNENKSNSKQLHELINWFFEIQRFNFIWKNSYFSGQSMQWPLNKIAIEIINNEIENSTVLKGKLFKLNVFKDDTMEQINDVFKDSLRKEEISKQIQKSSNKDKTEVLLNINYFLELKNTKERFVRDNLVNLNRLYKKFSYEHIQARANIKSKELEGSVNKAIIESIGNGSLLELDINKKNKNSDTHDKTNTKETYKYNYTSHGFVKASYAKIKEFDNIFLNDIKLESDEYLLENITIYTSKNSSEKYSIDVIKRREKQILNILWNMYKLD